MQNEHQKLLERYKQNEKLHHRATKKIVILEVFLGLIICAMGTVQKSASLRLNLIATSLAGVLTIWYFWGFKYRWNLEWEKSEIILAGIEEESKIPFSESSFFRNYLKEFNTIGKLAQLVIFDVIFLYFFSVSVTQLLKAINPTIVSKLVSSATIRTFIINGALLWVYYQPIRSLTKLKKKFEEDRGNNVG